jgi:hypothetical protein
MQQRLNDSGEAPVARRFVFERIEMEISDEEAA